MANRAGNLVSNLSGEMAYKSFRPTPLPPNPPIDVSGELLTKLIDANKKIATLESLSFRIPSMNLFVSMYVRKEALLSSQIEGTQCTLEDILNPYIEDNTNRDISDVVNYIRATEFALKRLKTLPLCNRLIKETHAVLLESVRGQEKNPGEFRYSQNWIGGQGSTIKNARYIPPNPDDMLNSMSDLEKYINSNDTLDSLIQAALIHYQFETIHPFLDGNGRVGRLLITLFLMEKGILSTPALYISYYLKMNRIEYYDRMTQVRRTGNYEQWVTFFLQAFADSAEDAIHTIDQLTALHNKSTAMFDALTKRQRISVLKVFAYLESNPIIDIQKTATNLGISYNTVAKAVSILVNDGILEQTAKFGKAKIYSYTEYLNILRKNT
ncbi:MAG: Fic family protein [Phascolarctobacterium sp.]|uniref:Fic family protein n=1 Tax=Phascolarctobacterium sp. TaxID=2049039 RepID=UPI0026DB9F63|nr:Fic family protein [Phascolarctobacterium sp.]MDO4921268.1 Fic family protein [Phascolarctobacterium sp.]